MNEKEREETRRKLRKTGDEFLKAVRARVDSLVLMHDIEGLDRLVTQVELVSHFEIVDYIRKKGFDKEFTAFLDLIGRVGAIRKKGFEKEFQEFCDKVGRAK